MDNEEIPYRAVMETTGTDDTTVRDEMDYSTLKAVMRELDEGISSLYRDFNAFELAGDVPRLEVQVLARQIAHSILVDVQQRVESAINNIDISNEG